MKHTILPTIVALGLLLCANRAVAQSAIHLTAAPGTVRVRQEGPLEGADSVQIACARGEYESFQVTVTAVGGNLERVEAEVSPLGNEDNVMLAPGGVVIYRAAYVPLQIGRAHV